MARPRTSSPRAGLGPHLERVDDLLPRDEQALGQAVLGVDVHQEPDRAAVHAVDRQAHGLRRVQGLEHEAVAPPGPRRGSRPPPRPGRSARRGRQALPARRAPGSRGNGRMGSSRGSSLPLLRPSVAPRARELKRRGAVGSGAAAGGGRLRRGDIWSERKTGAAPLGQVLMSRGRQGAADMGLAGGRAWSMTARTQPQAQETTHGRDRRHRNPRRGLLHPEPRGRRRRGGGRRRLRTRPPARGDRAHRVREHRQPRRDGGAGLGDDQQVCRGLSRQALLRRLPVRRRGRDAGDRAGEGAVPLRLCQRAAQLRLPGQPGRVHGAHPSRRHDPGHEPRCGRAPHARGGAEPVGPLVRRGAVRRAPRYPPARLRPGGAAGARASPQAHHRGRLGDPADPRLRALPGHRGRGGGVFPRRHGAFRGAGGGGDLPLAPSRTRTSPRPPRTRPCAARAAA